MLFVFLGCFQYLLGINVEEDDGEDIDGFFYPGIASRLNATIIEFGLGRKLVDYDIRFVQTETEEK